MRLAVDTSSFAKRYIQESGSDRLDALLQNASELALSVILVPELFSSLNRRLREDALTAKEYREAKMQVLEDVRDATILQLTPAVVSFSVKLLENNVLRAMGALHVACAMEWRADLFVTSDRGQLVAARKSGLQAEYIG